MSDLEEDEDQVMEKRRRSSSRRKNLDAKGSKATKAWNSLKEKRLKLAQGIKDDIRVNDEDDEDLYDVVDEDTYKLMIKKRKEQEGDFVVDDDGTGYIDDGQEDFWDDDNASNASEAMDSSRKNKKKKKTGDLFLEEGEKEHQVKKPPQHVEKPSKNIVKMFQTMKPGRNMKKEEDEAAALAQDDDLDAMLSIDNLTSSVSKKPKSHSTTTTTTTTTVPSVSRSSSGIKTFSKKKSNAIHESIVQPKLESSYHHLDKADQLEKEVEDATLLLKSEDASMDYDDSYVDDNADAIPSSVAMSTSSLPSYLLPTKTPLPKNIPAEIENTNHALPHIKQEEKEKNMKDDSVLSNQKQEEEEEEEEEDPLKKRLFANARAQPIQIAAPVRKASPEEPEIAISAESLIEKDPETGESYVDMYWMDMYEDKFHKPGSVFVFGKIRVAGTAATSVAMNSDGDSHNNSSKNFVSCMVEVKNIPRILFALPRKYRLDDGEEVKNDAMKAEVLELIRNNRKQTQASNGVSSAIARTKFVKKNYAFEVEGVPQEVSDYLEVRYPMSDEAPGKFIPQDISGNTFSHIFGTNQSAAEQLILSRTLMGPGWIRLVNPSIIREGSCLSWCQLEFSIERPENFIRIVENAPLPPTLKVLSLAVKTVVNPSNHQHEIVAISGNYHEDIALDGQSFSYQPKGKRSFFSMIRAPTGPGLTGKVPDTFRQAISRDEQLKDQVIVQANERALLNFFCAQMHRHDADIILGHNISGFDLDALLTRMHDLKISHWSKLGRVRRTQMPKHGKVSGGRQTHYGVLTPGRLVLDTYQFAKEHVSGQKEYSLASLCELLKITMKQMEKGKPPVPYRRDDMDPVRIPSFFTDTALLVNFIRYNWDTVKFTMNLAFKLEAIPLSLELTTLGGNLWRRTLEGGRAERIEYLLLHSFQVQNYLIPDKFDPNHTVSALMLTHQQHQQHSKKGGSGSKKASKLPEKRKIGRQKPAYSGGLVLEPEVGLYDSCVLLLDFNSLYPSIIQEYNICFTTIKRPQGMGPGNARRKLLSHQQERTNNNNTELDSEKVDDADQHHLLVEDEEAMQVAEADQAREAIDEDPNSDLLVDGIAAVDEDEAAELAKIEPPSEAVRRGPEAILPTVIRGLVERRKIVKNELEKETDPAKRKQLDVRQKALKLTANSMYGCLGFTASRFYAKPIAALITRLGREILMSSVNITRGLGFKVIYGDTDSMMVATGLKLDIAGVKEIASKITTTVGKEYSKLKLGLDGILTTLLLCKKKKYAAKKYIKDKVDKDGKVIDYITETETKGLDLVRRDWCVLSREVGQEVLNRILSGEDRDKVLTDIRLIIENLGKSVRQGLVPLNRYVVTRGLNKSPKDYPDQKSQPHVQVALAMMNTGKIVNVGDHIPYVICNITRSEYENPTSKEEEQLSGAVLSTGSGDNATTTTTPSAEVVLAQPKKAVKSSFAERAFHPEEVEKSRGRLQVDYEWYLSNQILPPVMRLCEPIDGIERSEIALLLGLDASKYRNPTHHHHDQEDDSMLNIFTLDDAQRFKNCEKVKVMCLGCKCEYNFPGVFWTPDEREKVVIASNNKSNSEEPNKKKSKVLPAAEQQHLDYAINGMKCPRCNKALDESYLRNIIHLNARKAIEKYQHGWLIPDDGTLDIRTRQISIRDEGSSLIHNGQKFKLQLEYPSRALHTQLMYLKSLVDIKRAKTNLEKDNEVRRSLNKPVLLLENFEKKEIDAFTNIQEYITKLYLEQSAYSQVDTKFFAKVFAQIMPMT